MSDKDAFLADLHLLDAGEMTLDQVCEKWEGRVLYIRTRRKRVIDETKDAIRRDPCRDYRVVARRYHVSVTLVYSVWNEMNERVG